MVQAADRKTIKNIRAAEKVENKSREAERMQQAEREAALQAERAKAEGAQRERELEAKRKAGQGRALFRPQIAVQATVTIARTSELTSWETRL